MKRFWTAMAVVIFAAGLLTGCNDYNNSVQYATGATILALSPSGVVTGGKDFTLTVTASAANGFVSASVVEWNGQKLVSTYVSATTVTAVVPAAMIAKPGTIYVNTYQPQSGTGQNGLSNSLSFLIYGGPNPSPTLTSISPTSTAKCASNCADVAITLTGTDFLASSTNGASTVTFTGAATNHVTTAINTTSISATQIQAVIPGKYLNADDAAQINVINPPSGVCLVNCPDLGGGSSASQTFTIGSPAPASVSAVAEETPAVSQDGRYVAFAGQQNEVAQILLRDTCVGAPSGCTPSTKTISISAEGTAGNAESHTPVMTADGRYVAFSSAASNLTEGAPAGKQIYVHDTCLGAAGSCKPTTTLISTDAGGALTGTESILPSISASGRFVAFIAVTPSQTNKSAKPAVASASSNSGLRQVFVRDTCLNTANCMPKTTRISLQPGDAPANSAKPAGPALSGLAKQVALADGKSSTVFTQTVPVDDRVFLAITNEQK